MSLPLGWRWVPASALIVDVLALIVTYSRGGYVGLAVFTVVAAALSWPIRRRAWPVLLLLIVVAAVAAVRLPSVEARAQSINPEQEQEDTATSRLYIWHTGLAVWRAHRTWGTGIDTFNDVYSAYRAPDVLETYAMIAVPGSAHNDYLQILATTGEVGVGLARRGGAVGAVARRPALLARRERGPGLGRRVGGRRRRHRRRQRGGREPVHHHERRRCCCCSARRPPRRCPSGIAGGRGGGSAGGRCRCIAAAVWLPPTLPAPAAAAALHAQASQEVTDGQFVQAVRTFQAALAADPLDSVTPSYFGDLLADLYDRRLDNPMGPWPSMRARAAELYLLAMRLNRWDPYPRAELGRLEQREKVYPEAAAWLREAVRLDPYTPRYRQWLGEVLLLTGDRRGAAEQLREAIRLYPVELLTIEHHEGRGDRYAASAARLAAAERTLKATGETP